MADSLSLMVDVERNRYAEEEHFCGAVFVFLEG